MIGVVGGAGFIGIHTVKMLDRLGYEVVVIDNLSKARRENIDELNKMGIEIRIADIRSDEIKKALKGVERIIHLAALISVEESLKNPRLYCQVNIYGTVNLLDACVEAGVERFVYASSAAVYGNPKYLPIDEKHPLKPLSPYGASKASGELFCLVYNSLNRLETVILRYFNVYGPGQSDEYAGVITRFIKSVIKGKPPVIYGDGLQTRDFIYVEDVALANVKALFKENIGGYVFNIANGTPVKIKDLAYTIIRLLNMEGTMEPVYSKPRPGDIRESYADISLARRHLDFCPQVSLEEGLVKTIKYYTARI